MIKVVILGAGNVAFHLCKAFNSSKEVKVIQLYNRNLTSFKGFPTSIPTIDNSNHLEDADVYIIAVSDSGIELVANQLTIKNKLIVHTSGNTPINSLGTANRNGVFYPLQTFSKSKVVDFSNTPICLEADHSKDLLLLERMAKSISNEVHFINTKQRKALHLAAVFTCNFVNHLYTIGSEICEEHKVSFDLLKPLIKETTEKIFSLTPKEAQTGPAKRNDKKTLKQHKKALKNKTKKELYTLLSKSIKKTYE